MNGAGHNQFRPIDQQPIDQQPIAHYVQMPMRPSGDDQQGVVAETAAQALQQNDRSNYQIYTQHEYKPIVLTKQQEAPPQAVVMTQVVAKRIIPQPTRLQYAKLPPEQLEFPGPQKSPRADLGQRAPPFVKPSPLPEPHSNVPGKKLLELKAELNKLSYFDTSGRKKIKEQMSVVGRELAKSMKDELRLLHSSLAVAKKNGVETGKRTSGEALLKLVLILDDLEAKIHLLPRTERAGAKEEIDKARAEVRNEIVKCMSTLRRDISVAGDTPNLKAWDLYAQQVRNWNEVFSMLLDTTMAKDPALKKSFNEIYKQVDKSSKYLFKLIKEQIHRDGRIDPKKRTPEFLQFQESLELLPGTKTILQLKNAVATEPDVKAAKPK